MNGTTSSINGADVARLERTLAVDHIEAGQTEWHPWPDGWPTEVSTALIDAVYSAQAVYKTKRGRGVLALVTRWRQANNDQVDSLPHLIDAIEEVGPERWAVEFGSSQHSPGRRRSRPEAPWKSATVLEAAQHLAHNGVASASQVTPDRTQDIERLLRRVVGIGDVTATYFMMLLGRPGVKADTMIRRYVGRAFATSTLPAPATARHIVTAVAHRRGWKTFDLEHSIWEYERRQGGSRRTNSADGRSASRE